MNLNEIASNLVCWHDLNARTLPWRDAPAGRRDPYTVWVSEVMAQQTRLSTVEAYFRRWMERFPTVRSLANADLQEVLKLWEGLGYYARARNLHAAALIVVDAYEGELPRTRDELLKLPGIGEYTAGAILSLAYGQQEPILDGNVKRVLSRFNDIEDSIDDTSTVKMMWDMSTGLVDAAPEGRAGTLNEALMELGAVVCTPTSPLCVDCPIREMCEALANGTVTLRPVRGERTVLPHFDVAAAVIWQGETHNSRLLIAQRPLDGMLGGMWEFPGGKMETDDVNLQGCLQRELDEELGIEVSVLEPIIQVDHAYTHFRITLYAYHVRHVSGDPQAIDCADWRWVEWSELADYPFPVTDQKIIRALNTERNS